MFEGLKEIEQTDGRKRAASFAFALAIEAAIVLAIIITPLIFFSVLPEGELLTFLIAPPPPPPTAPPPPPPPPPAPPVQVQQQIIPTGYVEPTAIPVDIPPPMDDIPVFDPNAVYSKTGVSRPGSYAGSSTGVGSREGINLGDIATNAPPPPPPPPPPKQERISEGAMQSNAIRKVEPIYPSLAQRSRITGRVVLEVEIDEEGNVVNVTAKTGHQLLRQAAIDAIKQWKYRPALVNGEPVSVIGTVNVDFGN